MAKNYSGSWQTETNPSQTHASSQGLQSSSLYKSLQDTAILLCATRCVRDFNKHENRTARGTEETVINSVNKTDSFEETSQRRKHRAMVLRVSFCQMNKAQKDLSDKSCSMLTVIGLHTVNKATAEGTRQFRKK